MTATIADFWNNLIVIDGTTQTTWLRYAGNLNLRGNNLCYGTIGNARSDALAAQWEITQYGTLYTGNPLLTDLAGRDYTLGSGSPALDLSTTPSGMPTYPVQYQPRIRTNGLVVRPQQGSALDLGALERGVS